MSSEKTQLEQLREMTVCVADTGEIEAIKLYKPTDATTNPSLILKAIGMDQYKHLLPDVVKWAKQNGKTKEEQLSLAVDRLAVEFGIRILQHIDGVISTELDARLSFDINASVERALRIIDLYEKNGIKNAKDRVLIKVASTWEGMQIAKILITKYNIKCNMTLLFSIWQAAAAGEVGAYLISPFVGRITDWHKKDKGVQGFAPEEDPGVLSVRIIYNYYKKFGYKTIVMGASFRNKEQVLALAGCDKLTIAPDLLKLLSESSDKIEKKLSLNNINSEYKEKLVLTEPNFRWGMCQDPCATEKLAEGIRKFAADTEALEKIIISQLQKL